VIVFTPAGKEHFDDLLRDYWVSFVAVDQFGITFFESERIRNSSKRDIEISVPVAGHYWIMARLWEGRASHDYLVEMYLDTQLDGGQVATISPAAGRMWVNFGTPPPPPPEPTTSGSE
jgi:hypothetical protein